MWDPARWTTDRKSDRNMPPRDELLGFMRCKFDHIPPIFRQVVERLSPPDVVHLVRFVQFTERATGIERECECE